MTRMGRRGVGAALGMMLAATGLGCMQKAQPQQHAAGQAEAFGELSVDQVAQMVDAKSASVFDNNSEEVFQAGHVPGAKWVAFNDVKASDLPAEKDRALVFYCANSH